MSSVKVFSPATIGNIGPGFDVLGLAICDLGDTIEASIINENKIIIENIISNDSNIPNDPLKNTVSIAAKNVLDIINTNKGISFKIKKGIPSGGGLGSSAASAAAGAFATNLLFGNILSDQQILESAIEGEKLVSGGYFADNVAPALWGGATLTQSLNPLVVSKIGYIDELVIIVITQKIQILTQDSRKCLPKTINLNDFVFNMSNTASITAAFCNNDYSLLKKALKDKIIEPVRSKLIPGFKDIKDVAIKSGADGLAISGSGPTLFAITNSKEKAHTIEKELSNIFIKNKLECSTFITTCNSKGTTQIY